VRFDYAAILPWMRQVGSDVAPGALRRRGPTRSCCADRGSRRRRIRARRRVRRRTRARRPTCSCRGSPRTARCPSRSTSTRASPTPANWWQSWVRPGGRAGAYDEEVRPSLLVLRLLDPRGHRRHRGAPRRPACPRTSAARATGTTGTCGCGTRALTLEALMHHGFTHEAQAWRQWLLRAIAGDPPTCRSCTALAGERRLPEWEADEAAGLRGSAPVRVGNAASGQYQADSLRRGASSRSTSRVTSACDGRRLLMVVAGRPPREAEAAPRPARFGDLGDPRARASLHRTRARCCGRPSTGRSARSRRDGRHGPVDRVAHDARRIAERSRGAARRPASAATCSTRARPRWTPRCSSSRRSAMWPYDDPRMLGTVARIEESLLRGGLRAPLPHGGRSRRRAGRERTRSSHARSGWWSSTRTAGGSTTPSRSWTCSSVAAATSGSWRSRRLRCRAAGREHPAGAVAPGPRARGGRDRACTRVASSVASGERRAQLARLSAAGPVGQDSLRGLRRARVHDEDGADRADRRAESRSRRRRADPWCDPP
jgi:hypothetical protein